ncbi:MAG: metallophosphoesterase family protein, partial [Sediminispirochaetaceae bacterium]
PGDFMISPGDIDPPGQVYNTIVSCLGADYIWYPVVGNHESETPSDMTWLRSFNTGGASLPGIVNTGPEGTIETTYSFDYENAHFVILNEYYDGGMDAGSDAGSDGDVVSELRTWLENDLQASTQPVTIVIGHEPAYPLPDEESGRLRHENDSLNIYEENRDLFWNTLSTEGVEAYLCGHTHNYSSDQFDGVWQIDVGHARGIFDTGARSTFVMLYVMADDTVWFYTYRLNLTSRLYELTEIGQL